MHLLPLAICVLRYPVNTFRVLQKQRDEFNYIPIFVLFALLVAVRIGCIYLTHYSLQDISPQYANLIVETAYIVLPVILWAAANFAVTSILDGETMIRESFTASLYSMVPYIVLMIPLAAVSHLLSLDDKNLYIGLQIVVFIWCGILFMLNIKVMNHYSLIKTIIIIFINLFIVALMLAVALLTFALANQLWMFIEGLGREFTYIFMR